MSLNRILKVKSVPPIQHRQGVKENRKYHPQTYRKGVYYVSDIAFPLVEVQYLVESIWFKLRFPDELHIVWIWGRHIHWRFQW